MAKNYRLVARARNLCVKKALIKALHDRRLSYQEVKMIIASTFDDSGFSYWEFNELQTILRTAKTLDRYASLYIRIFLDYRYHDYLHLRTQVRGKIYAVPYTKDHIPKTVPHDRRPGGAMTPHYLTIHSTANPKSTAKGERNWLTNSENKRAASYHIVVDEREAIECIPLNEIAWHAGDGKGGTGNTKSISLEICESGNRTKTLKNAISLTAKILKDRRWDVSRLKRHHDWSGKNCPRILIDSQYREKQIQTWDWFRKEVDELLYPSFVPPILFSYDYFVSRTTQRMKDC